jgi:hypothetical protein
MELVQTITQGMLEDYSDGVMQISKELSNAKYIREAMTVAKGTGILQGAPDNLRAADPHELFILFTALQKRVMVIYTTDPLVSSPPPTTPEM